MPIANKIFASEEASYSNIAIFVNDSGETPCRPNPNPQKKGSTCWSSNAVSPNLVKKRRA